MNPSKRRHWDIDNLVGFEVQKMIEEKQICWKWFFEIKEMSFTDRIVLQIQNTYVQSMF
jgi:hypothetical protein